MSVNLLSAMLGKFYSRARDARRVAREAGLDLSLLECVEVEGRYTMVPVTPATNTSGDQLGGRVVADMPTVAVEPAARPNWAQPRLPAHKVFARYAPSGTASPVSVVHGYLDANPGVSRKAALATLCEMGVNYHTARTQFQVWFKRQGR